MADVTPSLLVHRDDAALRLTLNRPHTLNALTLDLLADLRDALEAAAADEAVRAILLTGAGRGFSSGADLADTRVDADIGGLLERYYHPVTRAIVTMRKPVIAAVNGIAAGAGLSLALACDLRLVSSEARFALGFTGIGLVPDAGGSLFLTRLLGRSRALELAYTNRRVDAEEALRLGLAETLLPADGFAEAAWGYARKLARGPTLALGLVKHELTEALTNDLEAQLAVEAACQAEAAQSRDVLEGIAAFREKRAPEFEGR